MALLGVHSALGFRSGGGGGDALVCAAAAEAVTSGPAALLVPGDPTLGPAPAEVVADASAAGLFSGFPSGTTIPDDRSCVLEAVDEDRDFALPAQDREHAFDEEDDVAIHTFPVKDPGDRLDYTLDFTELLDATEQISTQMASIEPVTATPLVLEFSTILVGGKKVAFMVSGGEPCTTYTVTVRATTDQGGPPTRIFERSCHIPVEDA